MNPRLVTCHSCNSKFSERAKSCPKCGTIQTQLCQVCHNLIPIESSQCPECGDPSPFLIHENDRKKTLGTNSFQPHIVQAPEGRTVIKRILITIPFLLFIALIVGVIKEVMESGLLRGVIIIVCFLSIFKFWGWIKD